MEDMLPNERHQSVKSIKEHKIHSCSQFTVAAFRLLLVCHPVLTRWGYV